MKSREIFVLAVRILGVWALVSAVDDVVAGLVAMTMKVVPVPLFAGLAQIAAGVYCLRGAPHLVQIAFPKADDSESKTP
jgi:hypothetical protein